MFLAIAATDPGSRHAVHHFVDMRCRGVVDLLLIDDGDVADLTGRMVMEFTGSECAGYKTSLRFVTEIEDSDGGHRVTDSRSTSFEHPGGKSLEFSNQTYVDQNLTEESRGSAERTSKGIGVSLLKPGSKHVDLGASVVFPTQQIERIIGAAKAGKSVLQLTVYDGSDNGEKVYNTLSVIGQPIPGDHTPSEQDPATESDALKSMTRWPVTVSYFDRDAKPTEGEQTPVYSMSFELYENGVSRALVLDYNDFVLAGSLGKFDIKDTKPCK